MVSTRYRFGVPVAPHGHGSTQFPQNEHTFRFAVPGLEAWNPGPASLSDLEQINLIEVIANEAFEAAEGPGLDNPDIPAGYTYFGQFIDHDITRDSRRLGESGRPFENLRTPHLELDSVYGNDKERLGTLLEDGGPKFRIGTGFGEGEHDLPRRHTADLPFGEDSPRRTIILNEAILGDSRNDENIIISQLHLAFLKFHNKMIEKEKDFKKARRLTTLHYQYVVLNDFLVRFCGLDLVRELTTDKKSRRLGFPGDDGLYMPVEFSMAAFRVGHSMVRSRYDLNDPLKGVAGAPIPIFGLSDTPLSTLRGGRRLPPIWTIQWNLFLDDANATQRPQLARKFDTLLAPQLAELPEFRGGGLPSRELSLPFRNIKRGWENKLPSGQDLARTLKLPVLRPGRSTALWLYILEEARDLEGGRRLGPLGAHIVAETLIGLIEQSGTSVLGEGWKPAKEAYGLLDFLRDAGAPITRADLKNLKSFKNVP